MKPLRWTVMATQVPAGGSLGGVVRYTTELLRALAAREDVLVSALTTRAAVDTVRDMIGPDSRVRSVPDAPVPLLSIAERYAPLGLDRDADVVHGIKHLVPARSAALRVLTVHDMLLLDRPDDFGTVKRRLLPGAYRGSIRNADLLLCVSAATARRVEAWVPGASERCAVVHLATSSLLQAATERALPQLAGRQFALVVGDSSPRKNLGTLVEAWSAVRAHLPQAVLAIAGPPSWGRSEVGKTYDELVSAGAVVPLGHIDDGQLRWAYQHAGVVLCPSLAEGFGLPAAEALDFGAPVIISDDAALQEVCAGQAQAVLPARDVDRWAAATVAALQASTARESPRSLRTWTQVAEESVLAVQRLSQKRAAASA